MPKKNGRGHHNRGIVTYASYMFRAKDPVIDELRTMMTDNFGKVGYKAFAAVHAAGGPTPSCQAGWYFKKTRRPTSAAVEAAGRAMGKKRVWVNHNAK